MNTEFTDALRAATDAEAAAALIRGEGTASGGTGAEGEAASEGAKGAAEGAEAASGGAGAASGDRPFRIVAVTSCPTGIAHTYMAAESLENAGREAGVEIVVETQGSAGLHPARPGRDRRRGRRDPRP